MRSYTHMLSITNMQEKGTHAKQSCLAKDRLMKVKKQMRSGCCSSCRTEMGLHNVLLIVLKQYSTNQGRDMYTHNII